MPRELQPCGTDAAYHRHRARDEEPCEACRKAHASSVDAGGSSQIRYAALAQLADRHRDEFDQLAAELGQPRARDKARAELRRRHPQEYRQLITEQALQRAIGGGQ